MSKTMAGNGLQARRQCLFGSKTQWTTLASQASTKFLCTAFALALALVTTGCGGGSAASKTTPSPATAPSISSFAPTSGQVSTTVTITGTNLTGTTAISFNGVAASFSVGSPTQITASVPTGATTGKISVVTGAGTATSSANFTVTVPAAAPTITSFTPGSGPPATTVAITGTNFTGATAVAFNGAAATFTVVSAAQITTTVPASATTGKISVTTPTGSVISAASFSVTAPTPPPIVSSFSPSSGQPGTVVTITGSNLTGATSAKFNGTSASFAVNSVTQITATVPAGATTGKVSVTTPAGTASSAANFTVTIPPATPTISNFTPATGQVGTSVTINGTNFQGAIAVTFNGTAATFTVASATQITTTVPAGTTTGAISVTTPAATASSATSFTVTTSSATLDLSIDGMYVSQATQDYPNPIVPLVQDRSGWIRVFVKANQTNTASPQVRVQFVNGSTTNTLTISSTATSVPTAIDPNADLSWDAAVPSAWIQPGSQVVATVDPSNAIAESDKTNNQATQALDVRTLKQWKMTLIPVHTTDGKTGTILTPTRTQNDWIDFAKRLHPVPDVVDVTVGSTMNSSVATLLSDGTGWSTVLTELRAKRTADGITDRYYYGAVKVGYTSGVAGLGYIGLPAAIGWDYNSGPSVLAHEVGHNFGRQHSPCGGAGSPDPNYPYVGGIIGVPGWDAFATVSNLKTLDHTDIMGYCSNQWISDYVYISELNFRAASSLGFVVPDVVGSNTGQEGLLVWGRIENDQLFLEPAFRVPTTGVPIEPGPYTWEARDVFGRLLASVPFDAAEVADLPNKSLRTFSFIVPLTPEVLNAVQNVRVSQDNRELGRITRAATIRAIAPPMAATLGEVQAQEMSDRTLKLSWNATQYPVVMLKDATTGEVRGFLRGGSAAINDSPANMEIHLSDGVTSHSTLYQRPLQ